MTSWRWRASTNLMTSPTCSSTKFFYLHRVSHLSFGRESRQAKKAKRKNKKTTTMKKVTGIGGIFFKCEDPNKLNEWYKTHLGLDTTRYGVTFEWKEASDPSKTGSTTWSPFAGSTKYFEPSAKDFMINYRVADLEALVEELKKEGVTILDKIEAYDYGKFVHIMDLEGNKIQLWEPND
jgi:predicted enzyme related to lactoylglutathione lyase